MSGLATIDIKVETPAVEAAVLSFTSVFDVLGASGAACEAFAERFPGVLNRVSPGFFEVGHNAADFFISEFMHFTTGGAGKFVSVKLDPADGYFEMVAAIAVVADANVVLSHGWPILSVAGDTATETEAGAESICPRGGAA